MLSNFFRYLLKNPQTTITDLKAVYHELRSTVLAIKTSTCVQYFYYIFYYITVG